MAINVQWQTVASIAATTTVSTFYTVPSGTSTYGSYARDLVLTNSGTAGTVYFCLSAAGAVTAAAGFQVPSGGSVILTQCQVPASAVVGVANTTATAIVCSAGFASNVSYV